MPLMWITDDEWYPVTTLDAYRGPDDWEGERYPGPIEVPDEMIDEYERAYAAFSEICNRLYEMRKAHK